MKTMNMKNLKTFAVGAFMLSLALSPAISSANSDKGDKGDKRNDDRNKSSKCVRAWGHLFAQGWIRNSGSDTNVSTSTDCKHLPFGIWKKIKGNGGHATTTPDTVAPVISAVSIDPNQTNASVKWTTDENTKSVVFFGTTSPVVVRDTTVVNGNMPNTIGVTSANSVAVKDLDLEKSHSVRLNNLTADTTYYVVIAVSDKSKNVTISGVTSFKTDALATSTDTVAPAVSNITTLSTSNSVRINWKTDEPATSKVFYGTGTLDINATGTLRISNETLKRDHSMTVTGLGANALYNFVIQSKDASGNIKTTTSFGAMTSF